MLIGAGVFATTLAQPAVLKLPLQYLLKSDLHVSRDAMAAFFAAGALAWYFKPLAGILSDSVPLFGTRRRHYLLLSGVAAGGLWLLIGLVPRTYAALLAAVIAMNRAPTVQRAICAYNHGFKRFSVPTKINPTPSTAPAAKKTQPTRASGASTPSKRKR